MGDSGHNRHQPKRGGAVPLSQWRELGIRLTQCGMGREVSQGGKFITELLVGWLFGWLVGWLVGWLEFNVRFQHKYGYIRPCDLDL